jgi:FKBP-type peptidyl-prolyl cis-trans isomerase (trigger factor)
MIDKNKFNQEIEDFVYETGESYIDAIVHFCEKNQLEIESVAKAKMLNKVIKQKIESEASDLNLLREKLCRLPV